MPKNPDYFEYANKKNSPYSLYEFYLYSAIIGGIDLKVSYETILKDANQIYSSKKKITKVKSIFNFNYNISIIYDDYFFI